MLDSELTAAHVSSVSTTGTLKWIKYTSEKYYIYEDTTVTSSSFRSVTGTATIRFNDIGQDLDGRRVDAVVTLSNVSVKLRGGVSFTKPCYLSVNSWGIGCNAGSWVSQSGKTISVNETVQLQFFKRSTDNKSSTTTLAKGTFISGITDIDVNYSDGCPESVKLNSGISSSVYVLPASQRRLNISESNTKFTATTDGNDVNTYKTGLVYLGNADHSLKWTGGDCETTIFLTYYPSNITSTAGTGGTISPLGSKKIGWKNKPSYKATANANYKIRSVTVDGKAISVPADSKTFTYTFPEVYSDHKIDVQFEPIKVSLTYDKNLSTATGATAGSSNMNAGASVSLAASGFLAPHHYFTGWNTKADGSGTKYVPGNTMTMPENNVVLYAQWAPNVYYLTETHTEGGTASPPNTSSVTYGESRTYSIKAETGYKIESIIVDGNPIGITDESNMSYTFSAIDDNHAIDVAFSKIPAKLVYDADVPEGTFSGTTPEANGEAGGIVSADENGFTYPGYTFLGWSSISLSAWEEQGNEGERPILTPGDEVSLNEDGSDKVLYAVWEKNPTLTVKVTGHGTVTSMLIEAGIESNLGETDSDSENSYMLPVRSDAKVTWTPNDAWWTEKVVIDGEEIDLRQMSDTGTIARIIEQMLEDMHGDHVVEVTFSPMVDMPESGSTGLAATSVIGSIAALVALILLIVFPQRHEPGCVRQACRHAR